MVLMKKPRYSASEQRKEFKGIFGKKERKESSERPTFFEEIGVRKAGTPKPVSTFDELGVRMAGKPKKRSNFLFDK